MNTGFNFASLYEYLAEQCGRLPDDELGSWIGMYFGKSKWIGRTTRVDLESKGYKTTEINGGYLCEKTKTKEQIELEAEITRLQSKLEKMQLGSK